jgi:hypothetical protein
MSPLLRAAYRLDPALWAEEALGLDLDPWQVELLLAPPGTQAIVLSARQAGKTTAAAVAVAHEMAFRPGSLSVFAAPSQRQSAEAVRRVRTFLATAGVKLATSNVFGLETEEGSRVIALPGSDDSVRGLSVDAMVVADEAARLTPELLAALRPMRARHAATSRLVMLSTAWTTTDPFWSVWADAEDTSWLRIRATADTIDRYSDDFLRAEERALGRRAFRREYHGEPLGSDAAAFDAGAIEAMFATVPAAQPSPAPGGAERIVHRAPAFAGQRL